MIDSVQLAREFEQRIGSGGRMFSAPGRVNLIGEHTDYNDGFVLPLAIDRGTTVVARAREDRRVIVRSRNNDSTITFDLDQPGTPLRGTWQDYVEGVARCLAVPTLRGADVLLEGDVPAGAGLSSSAAIEVAVGLSLLHLASAITVEADGSLPVAAGTQLALAAQKAEHDYVGTHCGIMDQLVSAIARRDHALLIDCRTLEATRVPLTLPDVVVLICDSKVKHSLATSGYNDRRRECEEAARALGVPALRDVTVEQLAQVSLPDAIGRRARHVVTENQRTLDVARCLGTGDLASVGRHMFASHASLRDDFEVSCAELDLLVELAREAGVIGARMTGGGFGGCTVNLVAKSRLDEVTGKLRDGYRARYGVDPDLFTSRACDGARVLG